MPFEHDYTKSACADNPEHFENLSGIDRRARLESKAEFLPVSESLIDYDEEIGGGA